MKQMKQMRIYSLLCALLFSLSASAQISIKEYREVVLQRSLDVQSAEAESERTLAQSRVERTNFLPKLSADGSFTTDFKRKDGADLWGFSVEPRIEQIIYAGGRVRAAYRQSLVRHAISQHNREQTMLDVRFAADDAYWAVSAMQLYLAATDEYVNIIRSLYDVVQERYREGYVPRGDVLQVEARLSDAEYSRIAVRNNYDVALHRFNNLRRESDTLAVVLTNSIIDSLVLPSRITFGEMVERRPDVRVAEQSVDVAEYGVRLAQSSYNPSLKVGVSGSWQTYAPNFSAKTYLDGALVAGVSVPIFHWGERRHAVAAARRSVELQAIALEEVYESISLEESDGWSALLSSYSQMQSSLRNVDIASRNLSISTYSYQAGQATLLDVLQAQISWIQIYTNAITARYNYAVAWSAYNRITAQ
jgi:outer membrane protein TolC